MDYFFQNWVFWLALLGAALVRVLTSTFHSIWRALAMIFVSVFVAGVFTDAAVFYAKLDPVVFRVPVGALIALTADGFVRLALNWAANPSSPLGILAKLKGGGTPEKGEDGK